MAAGQIRQDNSRKFSESRKRITYAACLETLDHYTGELLSRLDDAGLDKTTMVVFLSDNGASGICVSQALAWFKVESLRKGGFVYPCWYAGPGRITPLHCDDPVIGCDPFPYLRQRTIVGQPVSGETTASME